VFSPISFSSANDHSQEKGIGKLKFFLNFFCILISAVLFQFSVVPDFQLQLEENSNFGPWTIAALCRTLSLENVKNR